MKNLKVFLFLMIPVMLLSCNDGTNQNKNRQQDQDSNRSMKKDTFSQGSMIFSFGSISDDAPGFSNGILGRS